MWSAVLKYAFPVGVGLYGLLVLATGSITGFGSRVVTGAKARVLGLLLIATGVTATAFDVRLPFGRTITQAELDAMTRETELTREAFELRARERDWTKANMPARPAVANDPEQAEAYLKAVREFAAKQKRRTTEADRKVKELDDERDRLRQEREAVREKRQAGNSGTWAAALAGLLLVWGLAWLIGQPEEEVTPPPDAPASAGPGSPAA